jgi:hypothetical protein
LLPSGNVLPQAASDNQRLADALAEHLRQSGHLHHYHINLVCDGGTVVLSGSVADQPQHDEALRLVQGFPGVERVRDHLAVGAVLPVQAPVLPQPEPARPPGVGGPPVGGPPVGGPPLPGAVSGGVPEPAPIFQAPPPAPHDLNPPRLPPYAWPTYAPYNNFSRVAIPESYPYNAWPFIGPPYPFPKIPPGWRSVRLQWDDGYWWYGRTACRYDWWHIRYW